MADTYTTNLKLTQPEVGENRDIWGAVLNSQVIAMLDEAISSMKSLVITGNRTLTQANGLTDQTRPMGLILTGSPSSAFNLTVPDGIIKSFIIQNNSGQTATLKYASSVGATIPAGDTNLLIANGADMFRVSAPPSGVIPLATNSTQLGGAASSLYARRNIANTFSAGNRVATVDLVDEANIDIDCSIGNVFRLTLGASRILDLPSNASDGHILTVFISQDAGGNRVITWPVAFRWPAAQVPDLSTAANYTDILTAAYDGSNWYASLSKGFA